MRFSRSLAILLTLALVLSAACAPMGASAENKSRFEGSWYAVSFVLNGTEYYPESWDQPLVVELGTDGRFTWSGKFYNLFTGTWYCASDTEIHLLVDNEDGTPGAEEDAAILNLNGEGLLVYTEENGPTILFSLTAPEARRIPETVPAKSADEFAGAWIGEFIQVDQMCLTLDQFADLGGVKVDTSVVFDGLDAYLAYTASTNKGFTQQLKMRFEDGKLVQDAKKGEDLFLVAVCLADNGQLAVHISPNGSGEDPLIFFFTKAE